ncbi:MAG: succinate dehydrogenase, hydrophobic membrane anchor protein [Caulobacteraceae bacterium]
MAGLRTPLGRARGLGSAKEGVGRFIAERVTSAALIPLGAWGLFSAFALTGSGFAGARAWLSSPVNAALLVLLAVIGFHHMQIGMRVIIEDYFARPATRTALLALNAFVCWVALALTVVSVLKVAFGAGAL